MTSDQLDKIRILMSMSGWRDVMSPEIEKWMKVARDLALLLPSERPAPYNKMSDHDATLVLRGEIKAYEQVLYGFRNRVVIDDANRHRDELMVGNGPANPDQGRIE